MHTLWSHAEILICEYQTHACCNINFMLWIGCLVLKLSETVYSSNSLQFPNAEWFKIHKLLQHKLFGNYNFIVIGLQDPLSLTLCNYSLVFCSSSSDPTRRILIVQELCRTRKNLSMFMARNKRWQWAGAYINAHTLYMFYCW